MIRVDSYKDPNIKLQLKGDTNYCTIITLSLVTGIPYDICRTFTQKFGRIFRRGMNNKQLKEMMLGFTKYKVIDGGYSSGERITINAFIKKHPKGKFYCCNRGHAFAIIDSVLYDYCDKPRREILLAWRFYNEQDLKEIGKTL